MCLSSLFYLSLLFPFLFVRCCTLHQGRIFYHHHSIFSIVWQGIIMLVPTVSIYVVGWFVGCIFRIQIQLHTRIQFTHIIQIKNYTNDCNALFRAIIKTTLLFLEVQEQIIKHKNKTQNITRILHYIWTITNPLPNPLYHIINTTVTVPPPPPSHKKFIHKNLVSVLP